MAEAPVQSAVGRWRHSYEEDEPLVAVYRRDAYPFPRARGRAGLELRADGSCTAWPIGAGDASADGVPGRWREQAIGLVTVSFPGTGLPDRLVDVHPDLLRTRALPNPRG